jgi:glycosyltransferase involved in cell wall biosynthesis
VGTERKNKNIERLLSVFSSLAAQTDNLHLVRVGDKDEFFTNRLAEIGLADRVMRPGRVMNPARYYNAADVYLCMDLHASFGMPNLEAMASGCPVVTSSVEAIPEIVGDACRLVNPKNVEEAAAAVEEVLENDTVRSDLRRRGLERAGEFTWEKCAAQTAKVYDRVLKKG